MICVETMHSYRCIPLRFVHFQMVGYVNTANYERISLFFNFSAYLRGKSAVTGRDRTRFQRAT